MSTYLRRAVAIVALALVSATLLSTGPASGARSQTGLRFLGEVKLPRTMDQIASGDMVHIDARAKRMYYLYLNQAATGASFLAEYDLRPRVPRLIREREIAPPNALPPGSSPYLAEVDTKRNELLIVVPSPAGNHTVAVIGLNKLKPKASWSLPATVPGFLPYGITYSPEDDRVYLIGDFSGSYTLGTGVANRKAVGPATSVVALEAGTGERAWVRPVPQCQQALNGFGIGAMIARSRLRPALYFACVTGGTGAGDSFPGQSGLARLTVSRKATQQDATSFPVELFPISGVYAQAAGGNGIAGFDPGTDRVFLQSLSTTTPGAWVFDGRASAWVGFVVAPDNNAWYLGVNERSGRYYMGSTGPDERPPYLLVTDGRASPVPQGIVVKQDVDSFISVDPTQQRVFVPVVDKESGIKRWLVYRDEVPPSKPQLPPDYDALTSDMPEGPKTVTSYSGGVNGYGARAVLVGGYQGALNYAGQFVTLSQLRGADRGLVAARVPSVDLREVGAAASAEALTPDASTEAELKEAGAGDWPWTPTTCLDGGGRRVEDGTSDKGGTTTVSCDLEKGRAEASSRFGAISGDGFSIGSSAFETRAYRDPKLGVVTESRAVATGVELSAPNGQSVSIARVMSVARTAAHGHSGTAKVEWDRVLTGVEISDEKGKPVQRFGECVGTAKEDRCEEVARAINDALGMKMRVELPDPQVIATKKGAFAAVQQSDAEFHNGRVAYSQGTAFAQEAESRAIPALRLVIFNDSVERSRLLVQLAAIQANSIYTITPRSEVEIPKAPLLDVPEAPVESTSGSSTTTGGPTLGGGGSGDLGSVAASEPVAAAPVSAPLDIPGVLAFLVRSPREALLVAGVWLLFGGAAGAVLRRRQLIGILGGK